MDTISVNGRSIMIKNGKCTVDGKDVTEQLNNLTIIVNGNVEELSVDACHKIDVQGSVKEVKTTSGDVECGNVEGDVETLSGDVDVSGQVLKNVSTMSGDVHVEGGVGGKISTMSGDVSVR